VLSSTYEGQPLAILEALMQGVPVVAYDINYGPRDMIEHDVNGLLVPAGDIDALTDALAHVLESPERRARLAAGARATLSRPGPAAVMQRWAARFADLLGQPRIEESAPARQPRRSSRARPRSYRDHARSRYAAA